MHSLWKELIAVHELGGAGSQEVTRVEQVVFTQVMHIQIWCRPEPAGLVGGKQHRDNDGPCPEVTQFSLSP